MITLYPCPCLSARRYVTIPFIFTCMQCVFIFHTHTNFDIIRNTRIEAMRILLFFSSKKKKKVTVKVRKHSNSNKGASPIRVHNALNSGRSSLDIYWSQTKNLSTRERCLNLKFRENIDNNKWPPFHWLIHSYRRRRKKEKRTHIQTRRKFNLIKSIKCHLDTWIIYIYWMLQCELLNVKRNGIVCSERRYWKLGSATCIEQRHRK